MGANWDVAWITGASTGLGRALALELAQAGVKIAASARSADKLEALAREQSAIAVYPADVTDPQAIEEIVAGVEANTGPIDLAVLNAGIGVLLNPKQLDAASVRRAFETNYMGVVNGLVALLPRMIERKRGHIALVGSVSGYRGLPRMGAYAPTKAALISLAECLKPELARFGIGISIINPGFIDTPMTRENTNPMPFLISAEDAAKRIVSGLRKGKFEIAFPWQMVWLLKLMRMMPYPLYFWWIRTFMMKERR